MNESIERILVPSDGSLESESAFAAIMPLVRAYAPEVAVLHVFEDPEASFLPPARIAKACSALRAAGVNAFLELREGEPSEEIIRLAREKKSDLIAVSTHGRGGITRLIVGSVTEQILRNSEIPVLVTRANLPVHEWKRIVVALDGSDRGEAILPEATWLARKLGASIDVLQIAQPIVAPAAGEVPVVLPAVDPLPYLYSIVSRLKHEGIEARAVSREGGAAEQILAYVKESGASLLCMTTHGRSGLARIFLGSIAEAVIRQAPCPVLLRRSVAAAAAPSWPAARNLQLH